MERERKRAKKEKKMAKSNKNNKKMYKTLYTLWMHEGIDGKCLQALTYTFSLMLLHAKRQNAISKRKRERRATTRKYFSRQAELLVHSLTPSIYLWVVLYSLFGLCYVICWEAMTTTTMTAAQVGRSWSSVAVAVAVVVVLAVALLGCVCVCDRSIDSSSLALPIRIWTYLRENWIRMGIMMYVYLYKFCRYLGFVLFCLARYCCDLLSVLLCSALNFI